MNEQNTTTNPQQLGHEELHIVDSDPWQDDKLGSKNIADTLTKLVSGQNGPLVLAVNGNWGTGKTFMLKRWRQHLEKDDYAALYYSAWEDDFSDEPLVSIAGQLAKHLDPQNGIWESRRKAVQKEWQVFLDHIMKNVISRSSGGILDAHKLAEQLKAKKKKDYSALYRDLSMDRDALRDKLKALADKLRNGKPLIFIVDELDRCRPTYAIALLERIKHIFNIPGVIFVLGMNKEPLCKSIHSVYGEIDSKEYLQRFIDYDLQMPLLSAEVYANVLCKTVPGSPGSLFPWLCEQFGLSLREVEHCWRAVRTIRAISGEKDGTYDTGSIGILAILRLKNHELYERFKKGKEQKTGERVLEYFHSQLEWAYHKSDLRDNQLIAVEERLYFLDAELIGKALEAINVNEIGERKFSAFLPRGLPADEYKHWNRRIVDRIRSASSYSETLPAKAEQKKQQICKVFDLFPAESSE